MTDYIDWPANGSTYRYWFLANPSTSRGINAEPGNYMFVKQTPRGWVPVYIGIADDLSQRIPCHERWDEAARLGATRIMGHTEHDRSRREAEERALVGFWNPALNTHFRRAG